MTSKHLFAIKSGHLPQGWTDFTVECGIERPRIAVTTKMKEVTCKRCVVLYFKRLSPDEIRELARRNHARKN